MSMRYLAIVLLATMLACARAPRELPAAARGDVLAEFRVTYDRGRVTIAPLGGATARAAQAIQLDNTFDATVQSSTDAAYDAGTTAYILHPDNAPSFDTACNGTGYGDPGVPGSFQGVCQTWRLANDGLTGMSIRTYVELTSLVYTGGVPGGTLTAYNTSPTDNPIGVTNTYGAWGYGHLGDGQSVPVNWYIATPEPGASSSFTFTLVVRAVPLRATRHVQQGDTAGGSMGLYCPPDPNHRIAISAGGVNTFAGSADPHYVAYVSTHSACGGASGSNPQVVLADLAASYVTLVSHQNGSATTASNGANTNPQISADGRTVAWESTSTDVIDPSFGDDLGVLDTNGGAADIYVRAFPIGLPEQTAVASADLTASPMDTLSGVDSRNPSLTIDGTHVAFDSDGQIPMMDQNTGLTVTPDGNIFRDVYVRDIWGGLMWLGSPDGAGRNADAIRPSLATYGLPLGGAGAFRVAFDSEDSSFVAGDTNGVRDVFVHDMLSGTTTRESVRTGGGQATCDADQQAIEPNAERIAFRSCDTAMVGSSTTAGRAHVYHKTIGTASSLFRADGRLVSGSEANASASHPRVENGGRIVSFLSTATNLVACPPTISCGAIAQVYWVDVGAPDPARQVTWNVSNAATAVLGYALDPVGNYVAFLGNTTTTLLPTPPSGWAVGTHSIWWAPGR